ncbi:MAG: hypothetical protein FWD22_04405 [Treponema sp.]|nr:hypothetical protein [Treponema sp.]
MYRGQTSLNITMPGDYRKAAERLFPRDGFTRGQKPDLKAAGDFSKALGIGIEYQRLLAMDKSSGELRIFLEQFQNNLDLLIKKTWVDKSDENRKGKLQDEIPLFMSTIGQADNIKAINEFSDILDELAYLFFGAQSEKDDFTEYTFRIDAQMGLFWWYSGKLELLNELNDKNVDKSDKTLWAVLLLGLCYLTNF